MIAALWRYIDEEWLQDIASARAEGDVGAALFMAFVMLYFVVLAIGIPVALAIFAFKRPLLFGAVAGIDGAIGFATWLIWTLAGDGSNDRERSR